MNKLNIAIAGVTGAVGETILSVLEERKFPVATLYPLASSRSVGKTVLFKKNELDVIDLAEFDFNQADIALFSAGSEVSKQYVPKAVAEGCIVIDNTSEFRYDDAIPLVVPEVNALRIADYLNKGIIANPNCSTIQMVVALKPLHDAFGITKINVATYQSVSGTGKKGITELVTQITDLLNGHPITPQVYSQQIAFNALPHIDKFEDNDYTKEEMKMIWETHKILEDKSIAINATAVRIPVLYGHSEAINVEFKKPISIDVVKELLASGSGIKLIDNYPTVIKDAVGHDEVFIGRVRKDLFNPCGLNLWVVADNVRKGAATNAVQIAEILHKNYL